MNKKALEFSFNMLFAILVGAVILFLAIYFVNKVISTERHEQDTKLAKDLAILTNPLDTGFAQSRTQIIDLKLETRVYNDCISEGFGKNTLSATTKSGIGKEWIKPKSGIALSNKYIFSEKQIEGDKIYAFPKKFEMPFYVADLIIFSNKDYCFVDAPYDIENEIESLGIENIKIENCSVEDIKVCFDRACDISVYSNDGFETGYVDKDEERVFFVGSLIYPAIFSDKLIYECNVKRLMNRIVQLTLVYRDKAEIIKDKCDPGIDVELNLLNAAAVGLTSSSNLDEVYNAARQLENKQSPVCEVF